MTPNDVKNELEPLLARCASGEAAALKLLYKNTAAQLFGVLRRILLRDDLAQEALQDVYVSVWRNAKDYRAARGSPFTWLVSIARNRAIDIKRSRRREVQFADPIEYVPEDDDAANSDLSVLAERDADARRLKAASTSCSRCSATPCASRTSTASHTRKSRARSRRRSAR